MANYLPSREEIRAKANELYIREAAKAGLPEAIPEEDELKEGGYWNRARDQLMREMNTGVTAEIRYLDQMAGELGLSVVPKKLAERADELQSTLKRLRDEQKRRRDAEKALQDALTKKAEGPETKELRFKLQEAELTVKELEKKLEAYPRPTPPIIAPPPLPPKPAPPFAAPARPVLEERVVSLKCWDLYKKMWNAINNEIAVETSSRVLSENKGVGALLISEALTYTRIGNARKIEDLANRLLKCECMKKE